MPVSLTGSIVSNLDANLYFLILAVRPLVCEPLAFEAFKRRLCSLTVYSLPFVISKIKLEGVGSSSCNVLVDCLDVFNKASLQSCGSNAICRMSLCECIQFREWLRCFFNKDADTSNRSCRTFRRLSTALFRALIAMPRKHR